MNTFEQNNEETKLVSSLIENGRDDFDIGIAINCKGIGQSDSRASRRYHEGSH